MICERIAVIKAKRPTNDMDMLAGCAITVMLINENHTDTNKYIKCLQ